MLQHYASATGDRFLPRCVVRIAGPAPFKEPHASRCSSAPRRRQALEWLTRSVWPRPPVSPACPKAQPNGGPRVKAQFALSRKVILQILQYFLVPTQERSFAARSRSPHDRSSSRRRRNASLALRRMFLAHSVGLKLLTFAFPGPTFLRLGSAFQRGLATERSPPKPRAESCWCSAYSRAGLRSL